jgi:hypothetical protein
MSSIENDIEQEAVVDPIEVIYTGESLSLSGRSTLEFEFGKSKVDGSMHLRITANRGGGGMWCKDWASASAIQEIVLGEKELTAKSFHPLHSGRSINTGGFVLAALKELGLIRANELNTRVHEHVPTTTFQQLVMALIAASKEQESKPVRKKGRAD